MTDGRFELWYGLIIMGMCIPPFVHYALKWVREKGWEGGELEDFDD
jgi:hypothetical protein